ncbi:hypothetical protein ABMA27_016192 [Loxostege sticticalis]|uniref:Integrase catalytic domain-containing protein n=1 Tax=Loxostege sticticalis TaxID=481309 RepID=A0ABR3I5V9_LOXSC
MEALINYQDDLSSRIAKAQINFKKSPKERITRDYVTNRLEALIEMWAEFRQGHKELLQQADPKILNATAYLVNDVYDSTEEVFLSYRSELNKCLSTLPQEFVEPRVNSKSSYPSQSQVKLPEIHIPKFSGNYTEWITFRDLFVSMIHKNESLDNVQRLQYLKGYLTGEAEQLIRYIPVSDANYNQCWKLLEQRYCNKKYLAHNILKRFLSQKNATTVSASVLKEFIDTTSDCLSALTNLGIDVSTWDIIIIHLLSLKLDPETRKEWELHIAKTVASDCLPTYNQMKDFLYDRFRALECIEPKHMGKHVASNVRSGQNVSHSKVLHTTNVQKMSCEYCGEEHKLCFCKKFTNLDCENRRDFVTKNRICFNCLGSNHGVQFCRTPINCRVCKKRHHSLLHPSSSGSNSAVGSGFEGQAAAENSEVSKIKGPQKDSRPIETANHMACHAKGKSSHVLLATALVEVKARTGQYHVLRALLDQGSQASFVTEATVQCLGLKKTNVTNMISGLGDEKPALLSRSMVSLTLKSKLDPSFVTEVNAFVLSNITSHLPGQRVSLDNWVELSQIYLADPQFDVPNKIDILLGAEVYSQILKDGVLRGPMGSPIAQCTTLGWVISGPVNTATDENRITVLHTCVEEFDLKKFWELESDTLLNQKMLTNEEQRCEDIFAATTCRDEYGRYVVNLPFRDEAPSCKYGESREIAVRRLKYLERKLATNEELKKRYTEVINEYLQLDHMKLIQETDNKQEEAVYLPHHAVVREDRSTTKVRVVFDASCKNRNGVSLNDTLMVGPTLQPDLRHLIMNWRRYPICIVADIVKMYRMVRVTDEDCDCYQRIVWRDDPEEEIRDFKLLTVTFGTASAPYLAVKTLNQVAMDHKDKYPMAAKRVAKEFYMDDFMGGCQTVEEGIELIKEMNELLKEGGFTLQKWSSNREELLRVLDQRETDEKEQKEGKDEKGNKNLELKLNDVIKILGLTWNRIDDEFQYSVNLPPLSAPVTKRINISDVSRLFDPLGWIAPCNIKAKVFIQRLWIAGTGWDEEPPKDIVDDWNTYRDELSHLTGFRIHRWLFTQTDDSVVELHGFSDASNVAYAAAVYLRVINSSGEIHVGLVSAKTRVAPVKQVSIPRLELCGAVLVAKLLVEIAEVLHISRDCIRAWTDSTIVLAWLSKHASNWKTFVANRVAEIHNTLESSQWSHVSTKDNPADCASRGVNPASLAQQEIWKFGPRFLREQNIVYTKLPNNDTHKEKSIKVHVGTIDQSILKRYSSLTKLIRVVAYCRRFITRKNSIVRNVNCLSSFELGEALNTCIKLAQAAEYAQDIKELKSSGHITSKKSKILSLTPFLDENGLLRVGGRISQSQESEMVKHPIILPHQSDLSRLIVVDAHFKTLHGNITLAFNYIRSAYWIIGCKNLIKQHIRKCIRCIRHKAKEQTQLMGSLPSVRVTPARAFINSGVDYAGPIMLRTSKGRGHKAYKGYICLFVCMVTKAVHIEVVSDLTSRGFLEAFKRFVARRGHCANLHSDNGTNFVGASKELKDMLNAESSRMINEVIEALAVQGTTWHFIPPRAPNFGGLWEGGVKSTKYHIRRVIGETTLTFEEMSTLLAQIEACLNSRPLTILSNNPEEPTPITPGHFLIGEPLLTVPETNYENSQLNSLRRWQVTQAMLQNFWRRWSREYLTNLMHRYKWAYKTPEPAVGDVVLVKEDDLPPSRWLFGKILEKYPGTDGITRVVLLKCKNSTIKRPTSKICILPVNM